MLRALAVILVIAWLFGMAHVYDIGPLVHVLLVVGLVLFSTETLSARRTPLGRF